MVQHRVLAREADDRYHGRTTSRGLKVTGKQVLSLSLLVLFFYSFYGFFKEYKPEVPSHNSLESELCGTLKNPYAIRKENARSSRSCGLFFTQVKKRQGAFFSFKKGNGSSQGLIRLSNNLYRKRCTKTTNYEHATW